MFSKLKLRRRVRHCYDSSKLVESKFVVYLNNDEPKVLKDKSELHSYLSDYRKFNDIFSMQIFRIETYSV